MALRDRLVKFAEPQPNTGCWLWTGSITKDGYGRMSRAGQRQKALAHRVAYEVFVGDIPMGLCVLHHCDTPSCVNPDHLYCGSQIQNIADRVARGRSMCGERQYRAKLDPEKIREIRAIASEKTLTRNEIGARFGVTGPNVSDIVNRHTWKHVL